MTLAVEIYAEKPLSIREGIFFKTSLLIKDIVLDGSAGYDRYGFNSIVTTEKRLAGLGRSVAYSLGSFPAGMGPIEARPGKYLDLPDIPENIVLELETNLILDPGLLADSIGIRLIGRTGKTVDIPLSRPDMAIWWESRGKYAVPLEGILKSPVYQAIS